MFNFGICYYPEQWPEQRWPIDAQLIAEAGFNVVRLAEFAWSRLEPVEGTYDFTWLDRAIEVLTAQGLRVILGTPTASPPPWLMASRPELFIVRQNGQRATYGNRREYCPNQRLYHDYSRRIVTAMAEHYGNHPAVFTWQIDNEFGERCYCAVCAERFQGWLRERHGSLEALNKRWGTVFWSHVYNDWSEIPLPLESGGIPNPGLALDFRRFASDSYVAYQRMQVEILRRLCPDRLITHNMMGFHYDQLNYFDLARDLDVVSWDNYPRGFWDLQAEVEPSNAALDATTLRGLKGKNIWVMEQQAGSSGWKIMGVTPRPGELRAWAYQTIAHGADAVIFFRWRTARYGAEQYWHGLLNHNAQPSRRYHEIKQMGLELQRAGETIVGSTIKAQVAIMLSYDSRFAFQSQPNNQQMSYSRHLRRCFRATRHHHVSSDITAPEAELPGYKLLVVPALYLASEELAGRLRQSVEGGGVLVVTARSGVKDEHNAVIELALPGVLRELCGVRIDDYDSLPADVSQPLACNLEGLADRTDLEARIWCDILTIEGAEKIATYTRDYYAGQPAVTLNNVGEGKAIYIATPGNDALYKELLGWALKLAQVEPLLVEVPAGVKVAERWRGERRLLFIINHGAEEQQLQLDATYINLLRGPESLSGQIALPGREVLVLAAKQ